MTISELLAVARCMPLSAGVGSIGRFVRRDAYDLLTAVDRSVSPLVAASVSDDTERDQVLTAFRIAAIKYGAGMWGFGQMAGVSVDPDVVALSTAFTRLYDDVMDRGPDDGFDDRFQELLDGGSPRPRDAAEHLVHALFRAIEAAGTLSRADVAITHAWQRRSRRQQAGRELDAAELREITAGKGGRGILVLYGLARPGMEAEERDLVIEIGAVGQLLDDEYDRAGDATAGIVTPANAGHVGPYEVAGYVTALSRRLRAFYGRRAARRFTGFFFLYQAGLVFRRRKVIRRRRPLGRTPLAILLGPTHGIEVARLGAAPAAETGLP